MAHFRNDRPWYHGRNMVLNLADHGFEVCGYDPNENQRQRLEEETAKQTGNISRFASGFGK